MECLLHVSMEGSPLLDYGGLRSGGTLERDIVSIFVSFRVNLFPNLRMMATMRW